MNHSAPPEEILFSLDKSRNQLFQNYAKRCDQIEDQQLEKLLWFEKYALQSYFPHLNVYDRSSKVLEIGCSRGYLLSTLQNWGFHDLYGVDLSPQDIFQAQQLLPDAHLQATDGFEYLKAHKQSFDIILAKAVMEHIEKNKIFEFLHHCYAALKEDGILIIDVPNMDWLFASHERYMDFTHELGFTKTSLEQVMGEVFSTATIYPIDFYINSPKKWKNNIKKMLRTLSRKLIKKLLDLADPEGMGTLNPIWERSIVGIGYKK